MKQAACAIAVAALLGGGLYGCKFFEKKVPDDIVERAITQQLKRYPNGATAMCGGKTSGFQTVSVSITKRGEKSTGTVHVKGKPWPGADDLPEKCEGDVEYAFTYTSRTYGSRRNRRTETTWYLDKLKLVDVQTKGVKFKEAEDDKTGPGDEDDDDKGGDDKGKSKKKKGDD